MQIDLCPRCGESEGDCYKRQVRFHSPSMFPTEADFIYAPDWQARIACSTGVIARELKRLSDFMTRGFVWPLTVRPLCPYCGAADHLAGSPASDLCRKQVRQGTEASES